MKWPDVLVDLKWSDILVDLKWPDILVALKQPDILVDLGFFEVCANSRHIKNYLKFTFIFHLRMDHQTVNKEVTALIQKTAARFARSLATVSKRTILTKFTAVWLFL